MKIFIIVVLLIITAVIATAGFILGAIRRLFFGGIRTMNQQHNPANEQTDFSNGQKQVLYSDGKTTVLRGDNQHSDS
ncbi:MAG: hypothetical protein J0M05_08390 [Candidatus Kapabacteria bacterium]|jgi:NADH:ubiquinone oxidoreductase subunit 4 (subunit M)|nr:hypothetical protein [Candidatus Kapabacteria bacterium]